MSFAKPFIYLCVRSLIAIMSVLLVMGCNNTGTDEGGDSGGTTEHSSNIEVNETWAKGTHTITGYVYVNNATLTIAPGAVVKFSSDAALIINTGGGLIADGSTEAITFTGSTAQKGFWRFIEFRDGANNANCKMDNCIIEYGGGYAVDNAMLHIFNSPTIINCTIRNSSSNGVEMGADIEPIFDNNTITGNDKNPIHGDITSVASIGYGSYTGNTLDYINLDANTVTKTTTIKAQDVPYNLSGYSYIEEAVVTVEAGTEISFDSDAALIVNTNGGLVAVGTDVKPIIFTGLVKQKGYWRYIEFRSGAVSANCKLDYCTVEYGGGYSVQSAMILVDNDATVTNSVIRNSSSHGIEFNSDSRPAFSDNTVTQNDLSPVVASFQNITYMGNGDYTGNGTQDYIDIAGDTYTLTGTVLKQNVPYRLDGYSYIENGTLTIQPGTTVQFNSDAALIVNTNGGLLADGTTEQITFTGYVAEKGYWRYIEFRSGAVSANCVLDHCLVEYGGGYSSNSAIINIYNNAKVTNSTVQHSESWGIYYDNSKTPTISGNTYNDNTAGDVTSS